MNQFKIAAFYHFADFADFRDWRPKLLELGERLGITGSILLAHEGVNGTISGEAESLDELLAFIQADQRFTGMSIKYSWHPSAPFYRFKVRLKKEIVSMGVDSVQPHKMTGQRLSPSEWNQLLQDPDVLLIDTRNEYECEVGRFKGAIDPHTMSFREFPQYVKNELSPDKTPRIAMYCTGGIRCEKASAYMLQLGFSEVYQLEGGILQYLEDMPQEKSLWEGECFVFDQRVAVNHQLEKGEHQLCYSCRHPLDKKDLEHPDYEENISCPYCRHTQTESDREKARERQKQLQLAKLRGEKHLGVRPAELQVRRQLKSARRKAERDRAKAGRGTE
jgi:UPF0176 protein